MKPKRPSRLLKNSAEPPLRPESAVRKAARKGGILREAIPFRANAAEAFSGATRRATPLWAGSRVRAAGQGRWGIAPAAQALLAAQIMCCVGQHSFSKAC